jgi:two-component system, response regulator PdtaR
MSQYQQQRGTSATVLVVENDVLKRVHSAAALRRQGFQVFEATDTTEAITILNKIAVDVLFSDVSLVGVPAMPLSRVELPDFAPHSARHAGVVLIVEDDVLLRLITASNLREAGFEVVEVANAAEAVIVLNSMAVDVMLTDANMPGKMNGLALARWVHSHDLDTRIILTSYAEQSLGEAREYVHFLAKPYDSSEVERLLRAMLRN